MTRGSTADQGPDAPQELTESDAPVSSSKRRRLPDSLLLGLGSVPLGIVIALIPLLFSRRFYYVDDTQNQGLGSMHLVGRLLRSGELSSVISELGAGGNLAVDPQYGLLFPPKLVLSLFVSLFDDVNLAAVLVMTFFIVVLVWGVAVLARTAGARMPLALTLASSVATSGFLFVWSSNWQTSLWSYAILPWLWVALEKRRSFASLAGVALCVWLIVGFAFPFATVAGAGLCLAWFVSRIFVQRQAVIGLAPQVLAAAGGAALGAVAYLPLAQSIDWTVRRSGFTNDGFLVPNLTELLSSSSPVSSSQIFFWGGQIAQSPIMYLGWFLLPLAALIPWREVRWRAPVIATAAVFLVVILLFTQLPSDLGAIRWPFRFIPGVAIAATMVIGAALAQAGVNLARWRVLLAFGTIPLAAVVSFGRNPEDMRHIVIWSAFEAVLLLVLVIGVARRWRHAVVVVLLVGVFVGQLAMMRGLGARGQNPDVADWGAPSRISELAVPPVPADVPALVLRGRDTEKDPERLLDGVGVGYVSTYHDRYLGQSYSSVSQKYLHTALCADYLGYTCPQAGDFLLSRDPTTGERWLDLLGYRYLMLGPEYRGLESRLGSQWREIASSDAFTTWEKTADVAETQATYVAPGVDLTSVFDSGDTHTFDVDAPDGGLVVLREVAWPGWRVTLDGRPLEPTFLQNILVGVDLPPGSKGTLRFEYVAVSSPALAGVSILALLLIVGAEAAHVGLAYRRTRKERK